MSDQITTARVQQYKAGIEHLVQQQGSRLRMGVRVERVNGKSAFFDQIGTTAASQRTARHGDTPYTPTPHARRMVVLTDYEVNDYIDDQDKIRTLNDPTNAYVQAHAWGLGRQIDQTIVDAAFGTAKTGEAGATSLTFSADLTPTAGSEEGRTIVHGSAGLTLAKLLQTKELFDDSEVDPSERRYIACEAAHITDMLGVTEIKDADYNTVKVLASGQMNTYLGFEFIRLQSGILPDDGSTTDVLAFSERGMCLALGKDMTARIDERPDKSYTTQAYACMSIGATRMQGDKIIKIECQ